MRPNRQGAETSNSSAIGRNRNAAGRDAVALELHHDFCSTTLVELRRLANRMCCQNAGKSYQVARYGTSGTGSFLSIT
jgi:hypothetical protein